MAISRSPSSSPRQDVPPVLALLGFGLVVGALFYFESPATVSQLVRGFDLYLEKQAGLVSLVLFSAAVNGIWLYSVASRVLGLQKQGSRLELLTGKRPERDGVAWKTVVLSSLAALSTFVGLSLAALPGPEDLKPLFRSDAVAEGVSLGMRLNFAVSILVSSLMIARSGILKLFLRVGSKNLPPMPAPQNGIVLGAVGEEQPDVSPEWVVSNRRALNGNILITGSIGGGKTQGTILPYLDQILGNFNPRPAILAIDPKGTFIPAAIKIIRKHGLQDHVLHMRLGGDVTFNPIFHEEPLKGARFLDTAQMIRAAAVNFMGKSFDSPFWEISAFNLIKNCLVLCGAKYREV